MSETHATSDTPLSDLRHFVRIYDADLDAPFCRRMIDSFNGLQRFHQENGRGVRAGLEDSAWTELNVSRMADAAFLAHFRGHIDRALDRYNRDVRLAIPIPNSPKHSDLVLKRYRPGARREVPAAFRCRSIISRIVTSCCCGILNDVEEGGETRFPQLGLSIPPREGRLLMFPPYWMYQHEGMPPISGDKYILSTYLLFTDPQPST